MTTITDKLAAAIELAEDAMAYVPEYFTNKHGMNRRMAALKEDFAAHASRQAEPSDARVEAAAMALARMSYGPQALDSDAAEWREHARAVLQAADAVSAGAGWMPIEMAPKDSTRILVSWPMREMDEDGFPVGPITSRHTLLTERNGGGWLEPNVLNASGSWFGDEDCFTAAPDLWQPLPNPPSAMRAARSAK